jgi:hypothetical protein
MKLVIIWRDATHRCAFVLEHVCKRTARVKVLMENKQNKVGFEVLTAASTKMAVFWIVAPCKLLPDYTALKPRRQPSS